MPKLNKKCSFFNRNLQTLFHWVQLHLIRRKLRGRWMFFNIFLSQKIKIKMFHANRLSCPEFWNLPVPQFAVYRCWMCFHLNLIYISFHFCSFFLLQIFCFCSINNTWWFIFSLSLAAHWRVCTCVKNNRRHAYYLFFVVSNKKKQRGIFFFNKSVQRFIKYIIYYYLERDFFLCVRG